jgi:immune inhibitor A
MNVSAARPGATRVWRSKRRPAPSVPPLPATTRLVVFIVLGLCALAPARGGAAGAPPELAGPATPAPAWLQLPAAEQTLWREQGLGRPAGHLLGQSELRSDGKVTTLRVVAILVDFPDMAADTEVHTPDYYRRFLFSRNEFPGGSVADFLHASSHGRLELTGEVRGWFTASMNHTQYTFGQGGLGRLYPRNSQYLAEEAIHLADPTINYADYDDEGPDGVADSGDDDEIIDGIVIIHAGGGDELRYQPDEFTAVQWWTVSPIPVDGVFGRFFTLNPEDGGVGIFCHELGHLMGLPDLYDKISPPSAGIGQWSLMCGGIQVGTGGIPVDFDAWSKSKLGFVTVVPLMADVNGMTIPPSGSSDRVFRLWGSGGSGSEYFLLENRRRSGLDRALPGEGLLIYHIDERVPSNDNADHYKVALEQADGLYQLEGRTGNISFGDPGDPYRAGDVFASYTEPPSTAYDGTDTYVSVFNIQGPEPDGSMTADLHVEPGAVVDVSAVNMTELDGNGDGLIAAGETAGVLPRITVSRRPAANMHVHLRSLDPRGEVLDADWSPGLIPVGSTVAPSNPLRVKIAGDLPSDPYGLPLAISLSWDDAPEREVPVELGLGTVVGRSDDFNTSIDGWEHQPERLTAFDQWGYQPEVGRDGSPGFRCGSYPYGYRQGTDCALVSPPILLPPAAELLFDQSVFILLTDSTEVLAGGVIEISVNGGDWTEVIPDGGYPRYYGGNSPLWKGRPIYSGRVENGEWHTARVNLSEYVGAVRVRFRFFAERSASGGSGWKIDNVRIRSALTPVHVISATAAVEGDDVRLSWKLGEPLPARLRWIRGATDAEGTPVGEGWMDAVAEGSLLDAGGSRLLPARYWLEGRERDGSIDRWGPIRVEAGSDVPIRPWRVTGNPTRGPVEFSWSVPLPRGAELQVFDVRGRLVAATPLPPAPGSYTWDGRASNGVAAAPGIYFARVKGTGLNPLRVVRLP